MRAFLILATLALATLALAACATPVQPTLVSHTHNGDTDIYVYYTSDNRYVAYAFKNGQLMKRYDIDHP